ncbi:VWD domain-containing protein [Fluviicola taffensis]|uniref:von Willebrand factor type D protein n=1 Tax=Fluviicola taffensis (strain DSM 16823 / NCIMB 13979 / RW262) TaxID=755732 RepID=F2IDD5_FLUTR|nr:VWD domain-containing protein [Fluviicola taffensis]AEA42311.1 von Willebrand factor type D protein [Fluviicola taffensis DSM 16823]
MKKYFTFFGLFALAALGTLHAQQNSALGSDFQSIRKEMVAWDAVRGEWLASSMEAMADKKPTPDRNFPEEYTPAEMFNAMPTATQEKVRGQIQRSTTNSDSISRTKWNRLNSFTSRTPNCKPVMGRTYGDPHLKSFDGATYSFQTVGEFTLVKSGSGNMNVQVRQRNQSDDFSLNTAVAMNVGGDRVCFYANEKPDGNNSTPLRIGGEPIYVEGENYYLEHGGTISRSSKNDYVVTWPTGERVKLDASQTGGMGFYNIAVEIYPCADNFDGILGNANGRSSDDFDVRNTQGGIASSNWNMGVFGSTNQRDQVLEKEYLAFLAKDFARQYRISPEESLFDYGFNQSTFAFTDESFPRVHRTLGDLNDDDRRRAQRECERRGFTGYDLSACVYDNGFLRIEPTPKPTIPNRTTGRQLDPVRTPSPNRNPGQKPFRERYPTPIVEEPKVRNTSPIETEKPVVREPIKPIPQDPGAVSNPGTRPVSTTGRGTVKPVEEKVNVPIKEPQVTKPERTEPIRNEPVKEPEIKRPERTEPIRKEPVISEPIRTQPIRTEPIRTEPVRAQPERTIPIRTEPVKSEPRYTPPPSNPVPKPVQRPASTPVSTPVTTPSKPITTPIRRGG